MIIVRIVTQNLILVNGFVYCILTCYPINPCPAELFQIIFHLFEAASNDEKYGYL